MSKIVDLTGQRFGMWTVLCKSQNNKTSGGNYNTKWTCRCDCGTVKDVSSRSLRIGATTNCGCKRRKDYTGLDLGMLKVVSIDPNDSNYWICKCDCGKTVRRTASQIRAKPYSCGCYSAKLASERLKQYNEYDLSGDIGIGYTNDNEKFYFDLSDYNAIKDYCWYINQHGYVEAKCGEIHIKMHRFVLKDVDVPDGYVIDHIDRNKANNSKDNLRILSFRENTINKDAPSNNSSGIIGVHWSTQNKRWIVQIGINNQRKYIGSFVDKTEAIIARLKAEKEYFGVDIAPQRNLFEEYNIL